MTVQDGDLDGIPLHELFRSEAEGQVQALTDGLLTFDRGAADLTAIEPLMRAAHSLKGAARIVNLPAVEQLAHRMEDCFIAAQKGALRLGQGRIDRLLAGVDLIARIAALQEADVAAWVAENQAQIDDLIAGIAAAATPQGFLEDAAETPGPAHAPATATADKPAAERDRQVLKVDARDFNHLLALTSESRVVAHALQPQIEALRRMKRRQHEMFSALEQLREAIDIIETPAAVEEKFLVVQSKTGALKQSLTERLADLEAYEGRLLRIAQETLDEVLALRMRPFRDGVQAFPRMVRDLARSLGKEAHLVIAGEDTLVDRDVLAKIEAPLNHLLCNAVDHGLETPELRLAAGKPAQGTIVLEARHSGGMLVISVGDDGQGVDLELVRQAVVARNMANAQMAGAMSRAELLEFLLLPAFSLKETASHISGRGVGLDVVQTAVRQLNGSLALETEPGLGFRTQLRLPLSQSVQRVAIANIGGEPYALPIAKIERLLEISCADIHTLNDSQFFTLDGEHVGLVSAAALLEVAETPHAKDALPVVVIGTGHRRYGLAVDAIRGEQDVAVQPIDAMFGKVRDVAAAAVLDDGSPVLILDVVDLLVSIDKLAGEGHLKRLPLVGAQAGAKAKRVLVVDDSITVREMERKLLQARGFAVDIAVDGIDGWNAVRSTDYDLVITDVDMPRLDGIELVTLIRKDARLHSLPVMIVSYKDRPEDRSRGLDAGADYYLTKGSFHDETLLEAVVDLIGESGA